MESPVLEKPPTVHLGQRIVLETPDGDIPCVVRDIAAIGIERFEVTVHRV